MQPQVQQQPHFLAVPQVQQQQPPPQQRLLRAANNQRHLTQPLSAVTS
ncbi:MAG: hypothetical protein ACJ72U_07120 [Nitrososphaeraceae archaeon]